MSEKNMNLRVDARLLALLRIGCAAYGMSMSAVIRVLIAMLVAGDLAPLLIKDRIENGYAESVTEKEYARAMKKVK